MALNSSRSAMVTRSARAWRQCSCQPASPISRRPISASSPRSFSSSSPLRSQDPDSSQQQQSPKSEGTHRPRWSYTPEGMKGPGFSINVVKDPRRKIWKVNEDPDKLDAAYNRLLGRDGERMLPDEAKWLAVTHKSFDQGRRGFNTKLAYFGRQILVLEASRSILTAAAGSDASSSPAAADPYDRTPFEHPALANVDKLNSRQPQDVIKMERLARLAVDVGLPEVIRWKPRLPENLEGSGLTVVLNTTLFAIVGAISLQHGAEVAGRVAREKILRRVSPA